METLPLAEVKTRLSELVTKVQQQHDQVTVTRNGRPAAVVVSVEEWESLHETLEILSDTETVDAIRVARAEVARGDVYTTEEVLAAVRGRGQQTS
jgi:prevent-host-death family protein